MSKPNTVLPLLFSTTPYPYHRIYPLPFFYSRKVNKLVCKMFIARSASLASITQEMLISLAPILCHMN